MTEPKNLVLQLLREMRGEILDIRTTMATKDDIADVRSEIHSLRADVASDLVSLEKRLSEQIAGLRRAVMEYHSSAIGHGVLFTEIDERVRKIEQHLNLRPPDAY
jgi:hypothetical protein